MTQKKASTSQASKKILITGIVLLLFSPLTYPIGLFLIDLLCNNQCSLSLAVQSMTVVIAATFVIGLIGLILLIKGIVTYNKSRK